MIETLIDKTTKPGAGTIATVVSLVVTFFSASSLFVQVTETFNTIWGLKAPRMSFIKAFIVQRVIAILAVSSFGLLVLAWLILDSWLAWVQLNTHATNMGQLFSFVGASFFLTFAFALSYRYFPHHRAAWRDVWIGAIVAALGVATSKLLLSEYFSRIDVAGAYGPAGSLVVVLLWIYYTAQVYFFGAELVFTYAYMYGSHCEVDEIKGLRHS
jgi:membrane protein